MGSIRKQHTVNHFKGNITTAVIKDDYTVAELCKQFGIALPQAFKWKKQL